MDYEPDDRPAAVRLDVWCVRVPKQSLDHPEFCESRSFLASIGADVSTDEAAAVPTNAEGEARTTIGPATRTVVVEFHDLDAP